MGVHVSVRNGESSRLMIIMTTLFVMIGDENSLINFRVQSIKLLNCNSERFDIVV